MLLDRILHLARSRAGRGVVVFDLDSTLLDNRPRQARILREYGAQVGHPTLAGTQAHHWVDWSITTAMRNAGVPEPDIRVHHDPAREFWRQRFFTSEYCTDDIPIRGAVAYVEAVREAGATVLYVTGRHEGMRRGTVANFEALGFPLPDGRRVQLFMKPHIEEHDDAYKIRVQDDIRALGELLAVFDNEPAHANGYRAAFADAIVVRLDTDHSGRPIPLLPGIELLPHFER